MADVVETEWQFDAPDVEQVRAWIEAQPPHAPLTFGLTRDREQVDSYLDTADWRLYHAGLSLRRRQTGETYELTLKSLVTPSRSSGGPTMRREITESSPDGRVPGTEGPVSDRVRQVAGRRPLQQLFGVRTRRRSFAVRRDDVQVATIELDETTVEPPSAPQSSFRRVEVELVDGSVPSVVDQLVTAMSEGCNLRATSISKYAMGLQAASLDPGASLDFGDTTTDPDAGILPFAYGWLRIQWAEFLRHEPGTRLGEDIEALHQMRVATRRLRAAIRVFEPVLPPPLLRLRDEMQWVGHELGAVRDLDVQIEELEARRHAATWSDGAALIPLIAATERSRTAARARLSQLLDSTRYDALVDEMSHLLRAGPRPGEDALAAPIVWTFAPPILSRRFRRIQRATRRISPDSPASEYHRIRILTKHLRYSLEIFSELYGRPMVSLTGTTKAIQDHLGKHQDAEVAIDRLRGLVAREGRDLPPETLVAVGQMMEQHRQRMAELRGSVPPILDELPRRWKAFHRTLPQQEDIATSAPPVQSAADPGGAETSEERTRYASPANPPEAYELTAPMTTAITNRSSAEGTNALTRMRQLFQHD